MSALKVAIRTEGETVCAYIASLDGATKILYASASLSALHIDEGTGVQWRDATIAVGMKMIAHVTGATIIGTERYDPSDLEGGTQ